MTTTRKKNICLELRNRECSGKKIHNYEISNERKVVNFFDVVISTNKIYKKIYSSLENHMQKYFTAFQIHSIYHKLYCMYTWTFNYTMDPLYAKEGCFHEYSILWHLYRLVDETSSASQKVTIIVPEFHD